jgi:hypothetical protein
MLSMRATELSGLVFDGAGHPERIAAALWSDGAALVRGIVPTERFAFWRDALEMTEAVDRFRGRHDPNYSYRGDMLHTAACVVANGVAADVDEFRSLFARCGIKAIADAYFAARAKPYLDLPSDLAQRRVRGLSEGDLLGFHMDYGYVDASGFDETLTVWMPLHDVQPDRCASLQVLARRFPDPLIAFGKTQSEELRELPAAAVGPELLALALPSTLAAGDVLIFTERTLHRTIGASHRSATRYSIDLRYAVYKTPPAASPLPPVVDSPPAPVPIAPATIGPPATRPLLRRLWERLRSGTAL